jgi:hypothetical protein
VAADFGQRRFFIRCDGVKTREALCAEIGRVLGIQIVPLDGVPRARAASTCWRRSSLLFASRLIMLRARKRDVPKPFGSKS